MNAVQSTAFIYCKKELASTNQNPKIELRREAPQLNFWVLYQN
jgi:hypothetical protein